MTPSCPDGVHLCSFSDFNDEFHVGIVVIISSARNFHVLVGHSDVLGIGLEVFWSSHGHELDGSFVAESFVGPFSNRTDLFHGTDTVVCNKNFLNDCVTFMFDHKVLNI
ncbi:hypothetical protein OGAPHI_001981 [Ogataea philodendri]|uniref:Uncharacterized protein n=1 Tax=Ogataea philodendri TaxID=1378263 RepID=A0A9P8PAD3_9ASCO|nr:uncharacterized protein OGAPHI_001981 [Ogataea philodendri]KAH3668227.1 hypothetical protein OGAPHI_001981 [Ogataea philodendri]